MRGAAAPAATVRNYRMIVKALLSSPGVRIYAESVLPSRAPKFNRWSEEVNRDIRQLADGKSINYVDLRPEFFDENHLLDTRYTYDGLHLNASGYLLWKRQIDPIVLQLTGSAPTSAGR
jgi:lysophospholipase L1-like esterase